MVIRHDSAKIVLSLYVGICRNLIRFLLLTRSDQNNTYRAEWTQITTFDYLSDSIAREKSLLVLWTGIEANVCIEVSLLFFTGLHALQHQPPQRTKVNDKSMNAHELDIG